MNHDAVAFDKRRRKRTYHASANALCDHSIMKTFHFFW